MPELDQEHGLVIHAPQDGGPVSLWIVDLVAGRAAFQLALLVEQWRAVEVAQPLVVDLTPVLEASLVLVQTSKYRGWLQQRIDVIGAHEQARVQLQQLWPEGCPTLRRSTEHTAEQLEAVERTLDVVEKAHRLPFPQERPGPGPNDAAVAQVIEMFPGTEVIDDDQPGF
jgi:hypothetical protein